VHCTDESVRQHLLGRRDLPSISETISRLAQGKIEMHCQLVICPSINDGQLMERSVRDLAGFFPAVQSVALVPVGLTGHRQGLAVIPPVGRPEAVQLIQRTDRWQRSFRRSMGRGFVYLADEIFLLADQEMPPADEYDGFPQLENGVGMVRSFLDLFKERQQSFPDSLERSRRITLITGRAAEPFMARVADRLSRIENLTAELIAADNEFFGGCVTVSGLLTGADILGALRDRPARGTVFLPPNCLNADGLFLDDVTVDDLECKLGLPVIKTPPEDPLRAVEEVLT
jgi:putative radical SAM enzyme (TIGR03279 family)